MGLIQEGCLFDIMVKGLGTYFGVVLLFLAGFIFVTPHFYPGLGSMQAQLIFFLFYFLQINTKCIISGFAARNIYLVLLFSCLKCLICVQAVG